jgi:NADP-dependent 3-hydroxy acid dehydrogenase YdfG
MADRLDGTVALVTGASSGIGVTTALELARQGAAVALAALPHLVSAAEDGPRQVADMVNISSVAGRIARGGSAVCNAAKHGVGAFSEALRQEAATRHVRVSVIEPGVTETELAGHNRPVVLDQMNRRFGDITRLQAVDIAEAIGFVVTRPRHMIINELMVRPTEQEG